MPVDAFRIIVEEPGVGVYADTDATVEGIILVQAVDGYDGAIPVCRGDG